LALPMLGADVAAMVLPWLCLGAVRLGFSGIAGEHDCSGLAAPDQWPAGNAPAESESRDCAYTEPPSKPPGPAKPRTHATDSWRNGMRGKPVCRLHGGKGGGPRGERNGTYRTGRYTAEAKAERRQVRMLIRGLRQLMDSGE
jgi:hypothetical protein